MSRLSVAKSAKNGRGFSRENSNFIVKIIYDIIYIVQRYRLYKNGYY